MSTRRRRAHVALSALRQCLGASKEGPGPLSMAGALSHRAEVVAQVLDHGVAPLQLHLG